MKELLESGKFSEIMDIDVDLIQITQEIRDRCADNYCGFYGKNHMCPPAVGGLKEYREIIRKYEKGLLFSKVYALKNKYDYKRMVESGVEFRNEIQKIRNEMKSKNLDCFFFSAGTCSLCQKCAILTDEPCRFPDDAIPSLEATGIDVIRLSRDYRMTYNSGENNVTYFGLLIYNN